MILYPTLRKEFQVPTEYKELCQLDFFGSKRDEITGEWRKLHNEKLHYLYSSSTIMRVIKSRRMRWAGM
jgi:hypothetical protein